MDYSVLVEIKDQSFFLSPSQQPYFPFPSPPPPSQPTGFNLSNKVSPSMLLIIIILAVIFFISGVLHLLVRLLLRPPNRGPDDNGSVTAFQGQLQQLFHLHDAGVDQSFIDTLPVFNYKAIIGIKDPFDCAVCLCEFETEDKLRLLPKCSHAFHMECIDTWLLSHSTCPLCRASLLADFSTAANCSPIVLVLEAGSETSREIVPDRESSNSHDLSNEFRDPVRKSGDEIQDERRKAVEKVVSVKLGKYRSVDGGGEGSGGDSNAEARRCFSMGSFAYVMDENLSLQVPIRTPMKKQSSKKPSLPPLTPGHRLAMSECGCDSRREFSGFEAFRVLDIQSGEIDDTNNTANTTNDKSISSGGKESFSVSKIWLRGKREKSGEEKMEWSRRAFSFRFPVNRNATAGEEMKAKINGRRTISEIDMRRWEIGGSEDEEIRSCNSLDTQTNHPSFARRTLLWIMGRPNKVVHPSFSSNV
ncbi:hypothetical protein CASFOL_013918 [Castilleja foliolosa]|uniref:RING-type E3 ubiquitin transferase n=1 Tax=Castilleja foliolosa TaxID=1961234 RepID=A0ABD3DLE1_9LAMI